MHRALALSALAATLVFTNVPVASARKSFRETDLVSDLPGRAPHLDPDLVNPWGIVASRHGDLRIADNGAGVSSAYSGTGVSLTPLITIPPAGSGNPTGVVTNTMESAFGVSSGDKSGASRFIFASEDGSISAWSPDVDPDHAIQVASTPDGVYKGLALGHTKAAPFLFATNFHNGTVDVFDRHFAQATWAGAFTDSTLPDGYAPFNIANIKGKLFVTFAKQKPDRHDDLAGPGFGFLDVFDMDGHLQRRLVSQGPLDAPWGMALAPEGFGEFGGALLVGNFGDGLINAFDPNSGAFLGALEDTSGSPIAIDDLWGLAFARESEGDSDSETEEGATLYFAAGIEGESHGLVGSIRAAEGENDHEDGHDKDHKGEQGRDGLQVSILRANPAQLSDPAGIQLRVSSDTPAIVRLRIYDASGRMVAEPVRDLPISGSLVARWDGLDSRGSKVPAGTYFYHATAGSKVAHGRLVLLR